MRPLRTAALAVVLLVAGCAKPPRSKPIVYTPPPAPGTTVPSAVTVPAISEPVVKEPEPAKKEAKEPQPVEIKEPAAPDIPRVTAPPEAPKELAPKTTAKPRGKTPRNENKAQSKNGGTPLLVPQLSREQEREYRRRLDAALSKTDKNLGQLRRLRLNSEQQSTMQQAIAFRTQAQQALRAHDLTRAVTLAEKAEVLSRELLQGRG